MRIYSTVSKTNFCPLLFMLWKKRNNSVFKDCWYTICLYISIYKFYSHVLLLIFHVHKDNVIVLQYNTPGTFVTTNYLDFTTIIWQWILVNNVQQLILPHAPGFNEMLSKAMVCHPSFASIMSCNTRYST